MLILRLQQAVLWTDTQQPETKEARPCHSLGVSSFSPFPLQIGVLSFCLLKKVHKALESLNLALRDLLVQVLSTI